MEEYFVSIEDLFQSTIEYTAPSGAADPVMGYAITALVLSVIPVIPTMIWAVIRWRVPDLIFYSWGHRIPIHSWGAWWAIAVAGSILLLTALDRINRWTVPKSTPELLREAPMRFALSFALGRELQRYRKNRLPKHIREARRLWAKLVDALEDLWGPARHIHLTRDGVLRSPEDPLSFSMVSARIEHRLGEVSRSRSFFSRILRLSHDFDWFKLTESTTRIVTALDSLLVKVPTRLRDTKDIASLADVFTRLASYLYTQIPELFDLKADETVKLEELREKLLLSFCDVIEPLPAPVPKSRKRAEPEPSRSRFAQICAWAASTFDSDLLLLRFFSWLTLSSVLVGAASVLLLHFVPKLKVENIATVAFATPFAVAAGALAAQLRKRT